MIEVPGASLAFPGRQRRWLSGFVLAIGLFGLHGCEAPRYGLVASQPIPNGVVELWAPEGILSTGGTRVVISLGGRLVEEVDIPPRLRFLKTVSGSGYPVEREVRLHRSGPREFAGAVVFPEPGSWLCRLEVAGERMSFEVTVE